MSQAASHLANSRAPLSCRKGKIFKGGKGAEKGNYEQRMHCFRQGHPPKGNGGGL